MTMITDNKPQEEGGIQTQSQRDKSGAVSLAILGGILLITGAGSFISSIWDDVDRSVHLILAIIGVLLAHAAGYLFSQKGNHAYSGSIFHVVGILLFPTVFYIGFDMLEGEYETAMQVFVASTTGALAYATFALQSKRSIFVIFGTLGVALSLGSLGYIAFNDMLPDAPEYIYLVLLGLIGYFAYSHKNVLYPAGFFVLSVVGVIGFAFYGFIMRDFVGSAGVFNFWDVWYPILAAGMIYFGNEWKSSLVRVTGIIAMVGAVIRLFVEYIDNAEAVYAVLAALGAWLVYYAFGVARRQEEKK